MSNLFSSLRLWLLTWALCCVGYVAVVWAVGQVFVPEAANGHLVRTADGGIVGSALLAQAFTRPEYLWPRPSAVNYAADGTGGSNLSPTNPLLTERAREILATYDLPDGQSLPADLVTASGSGMDPHVTRAGALVQADRIATARGTAPDRIRALIEDAVFDPSGFGTEYRVVNVLAVNLALDAEIPLPETPVAPDTLALSPSGSGETALDPAGTK